MSELYYGLYHNKKQAEIKIITNPNCMIDSSKLTSELKYFNDCYYLSTDRNLIKQKAEEIRSEWIAEAFEKYKTFYAIKIKKKYNKRK